MPSFSHARSARFSQDNGYNMKAVLSLAVSSRVVDAVATSWASYPPRKGASHAVARGTLQAAARTMNKTSTIPCIFPTLSCCRGGHEGDCYRRQKTPIYNRLPRSAGKREKGSVRNINMVCHILECHLPWVVLESADSSLGLVLDVSAMR